MTTDTILALIGVIFPVFVLIAGVSWRGAVRLTSIEITLENADEKAGAAALAALKAADKAEAAHAEILKLTHAIDNLPCHACPVTVPPRRPGR
jgi:hypothetical protein